MISSLALFGLSACEEALEDRARHLTGPEAIEWTSGQRFVVAAQPEMRGYLNLSDGMLEVSLTGFPPGTQATLGSQTVAVRDNGAANLETRMTAYYGAVSTRSFLEGKVEGASLELAAPGQPSFVVTLPAQTARVLDTHLLSVAEGPLLYVGETPVAVKPPRSLFWHHGADNEILGAPAATLGQIDAIGVLRSAATGQRVCPAYQGKDGSVADLTLELTEYSVTVYDRRTGEALADRSFPPVDRCPDSSFQFAGKVFKTTTVLPEADVRAWLAGLVAPQAGVAQ